jgi:hypothetical protein
MCVLVTDKQLFLQKRERRQEAAAEDGTKECTS